MQTTSSRDDVSLTLNGSWGRIISTMTLSGARGSQFFTPAPPERVVLWKTLIKQQRFSPVFREEHMAFFHDRCLPRWLFRKHIGMQKRQAARRGDAGKYHRCHRRPHSDHGRGGPAKYSRLVSSGWKNFKNASFSFSYLRYCFENDLACILKISTRGSQ